MLPRLCLILSFLLSGDSILPNGIRVYDSSSNGSSGNLFEVTAGYRTGVPNENVGGYGRTDVVASFLKSAPSVRALAVAAYGSGGEIEFFSDVDQVGFRLKMPVWARPMVDDSIAEFFSETPQKNPELVDRALDEVRSRIPSGLDVRSKVEEQFRIALLGPGAKLDSAGMTREAIGEFFAGNYGTDHAFVVLNGTPANSLQGVVRRSSAVSTKSGTDVVRGGSRASPAPVQPPFIQTDLDEGAVILGTLVAPIYYRNWYAYLMLDRWIQQAVPQKPMTVLLPSLEPYYYRMEVSVPSGQAADTVATSLHQNLEQLQYVRPAAEQLEIARRSALQYLESGAVVQWFLSLGVPERRLEGIEWVRSFSSDDMRVAARDLIESNPVIAGWSPKIKSLRLDVESLSDIAARTATSASKVARALPPLPAPAKAIPFPPHTEAPFQNEAPVQLDSGVSLVASPRYAVFVAPNSLKVFDSEPDSDSIQASYGAFRSSRILVMAPPESLDRAKQQWARFRGNVSDNAAVPITGNITSADIPALLVLKALLDRRSIEAGIWNDTRLEIRASEGSTLSIQGSEINRKLVVGWIREIASSPISDADLDWAREAALHRLPELRADIQSLIWEWNPDGVLVDIHIIPASQIQDVARIYLQ